MSETPALYPPIVTQANCASVGMTERQFLDWCRAHPELVSPIGKLRAVPTEDLIRHLRESRKAAVEAAAANDIDSVLALVGRQRKAGSAG